MSKKWLMNGGRESHSSRSSQQSIDESMYRRRILALSIMIDPTTEKEIQALQHKKEKSTADFVILCFLRFKQMRNMMRKIPHNPEEWLNVQLQMVKKKLGPLKYLTDKDVKKIIIRVRYINAMRDKDRPSQDDPDLPSCYYWNSQQVGEWLDSIGFSHLKNMFALNSITGCKLIALDASVLNQMGLKYFQEIQNLTSKIRDILKIHRPNMMRALVRKVPFEQYLKKRQWKGTSYNSLTFEKFCQANGYPYQVLKDNPLALIECTCELAVYMSAFAEVADIQDDMLSQHNSLVLAPTVEFNVRHILIRDKIVAELINELLDIGTSCPIRREISTAERLQEIFEAGFAELGLSPDEMIKRLEFGRLIAEEMLREAKRTRDVLADLSQFRKFLEDHNISKEDLERMRVVASEFFSAVANIGSLLAFGELDLETIFRQQPEFNAFVDEIIGEAETKLSDVVPDAANLIVKILIAAKRSILEGDLPHLNSDTIKAVHNYAGSLLDAMMALRTLNIEDVKRQRDSGSEVPFGSPKEASRLSPLFSPDESEFESEYEDEDSVLPQAGRSSTADIEHLAPQCLTITRKFGGTVETGIVEVDHATTVPVETGFEPTPKDDISATEDQVTPIIDGMQSPEKLIISTELMNILVEHVTNEVIQEALTHLLDVIESYDEAGWVLLTLEEYKNAKRT